MTKLDAIKRINERLGKSVLNEQNTQFANVVPCGSDAGWWLKLPFPNFKKESHFILNNENGKTFLHLTIQANQILSPAMRFRSSAGAADAFISSASPKRLVDTLDGGRKYNFSKHLVDSYRH
jgi:hypothetical protein